MKQPWAALLVAGVKTVEVRTWQTHRRGRVLIHASKIPDDRPEGWAWVTTPELRELANLRGGIIGVGNLTDCVRYSTAEAFAAAVEQHRNAPEWFRPAGLYGFVFQNLRPIEYHAYSGQTMFFTVSDFNPTGEPLGNSKLEIRNPKS
ncbi:MAG: ASCH domain-containing protein [Gemmataceae bacterium]